MSNGNGHHWSKFWWKDWDADEGLKMCGFAAQGLWMRLLCVMHKATPVGHLLVNGRAPNTRQIVSLCGGDMKEVAQLLRELEENGVFSRNDDGVIYSRRMVRDAVASDAGREFVSRRWDKAKPNGSVNTPPNRVPTERATKPPKKDPSQEPATKKLEADSEAEEDKEREEVNKTISSFGDVGRARVIETAAEALQEPGSYHRECTNIVGIVGRRFQAAPMWKESHSVEKQAAHATRQSGDEVTDSDPPPADWRAAPREPTRSVEEMIAVSLEGASQSEVAKARAAFERRRGLIRKPERTVEMAPA
jgi:hypothetical protein